MAKQIEIKITGSGTKSEIVKALKELADSIQAESAEGMTLGKTFEDSTLCAETS